MGNPYSVQIADASGGPVRVAGDLTFTDPANQPGGGSSAGAATVRGPFTFAYNTPDLAAGVAVYTPAVGDWLLDAWFSVTTAFNGTTPGADIGQFPGPPGMFASSNVGYPVDLKEADSVSQYTSGLLLALAGGPGALTLRDGNIYISAPSQYGRIAPAKFVTTDPLLLVVSQSGAKGATAIDSTAGAGQLFIVTATPVAFA